MLFHKFEKSVDVFNLFGEKSISELYHPDSPFRFSELFHLKSRSTSAFGSSSSALSILEAEKRILRYLRFTRGSVESSKSIKDRGSSNLSFVPLGGLTFAGDAVKALDKLLAVFDSVAGGQLFGRRKAMGSSGSFPIKEGARGGVKYLLPFWFEGSCAGSVAAWVVAHFEARIVEAFQQKNTKIRGVELPFKISERVTRTWNGCNDVQKNEILSKAVGRIDQFSKECFSRREEKSGKPSSFSSEERMFSMLLHLSGLIDTPKETLKGIIMAKLQLRREKEGEKNFFVNCLSSGAKESYQIESFFGNLICAEILDMSSRQIIDEICKEEKKKKSHSKGVTKSKQINKSNSKETKIVMDPIREKVEESTFPKKQILCESDETNEEEKANEASNITLSLNSSPTTASHSKKTDPAFQKASEEISNSLKPRSPEVTKVGSKKKSSRTWNSDEEIEETQNYAQKHKLKQNDRKKPKLIKNHAQKSKEEEKKKVEVIIPKKRESAPPIVVRTWDEDEPSEKQEKTVLKENNLYAKFKNRKEKYNFESYVDKESLIKEVVMGKLSKKLDEEIIRITQDLSSQAETLEPARKLIRNRISSVVKQTSKGSYSVIEYGSYNTRLLTPYSDMDLAIDTGASTLIFDRKDVIAFLKLLSENLSLCKFVVDVRAILTATVPVIKLEADPSIEFEHLPGTTGDPTIKVDIIIKTKDFYEIEHASTRTTTYINSIKTQFPSFFRNVLVLKYSLNCLDLMNAYKGGLNSYGLCILYVAFLHEYKHEKEICHGKTFLNFLKFISEDFDYANQAVHLKNFGVPGCFSSKATYNTTAPLVIFDPTHFMYQNVTVSCMIFPKITEFLKGVSEQFNSIKGEVLEKFASKIDFSRTTEIPVEIEKEIENFISDKMGSEGNKMLDSLLGLKNSEHVSDF